MSNYQYACITCGYRFERSRPANAGVDPECPTCGSPKVQKQHFSASSPAATASLSSAPYTGG